MKNNYKIVYDIQKDIWNWIDALQNSFMEFNWIDNIDNPDDTKIVKQILGLKKQDAKQTLKPYLEKQKEDPNSRLNKSIKTIQKDFDTKYQNACEILEKITNHPMVSNNFIFYVTTFPRCPYSYDNYEIFMYDYPWSTPIDGFLHEGLHFQFTHFWGDDQNSPVSKLNDDQFDYIKEALTVVLDEDLKPVLSKPDHGYPNQTEYRKLLHKHWQKYHDFDKLVNFGLSKLNDFIK